MKFLKRVRFLGEVESRFVLETECLKMKLVNINCFLNNSSQAGASLHAIIKAYTISDRGAHARCYVRACEIA